MRSTSNSRVLSFVAVLALVSIVGVVTVSLAAEYVAPRDTILQPEQLNNLVDRSKKADRLKVFHSEDGVQRAKSRRIDHRPAFSMLATSESIHRPV
jgi:hypothetical protein